MANFQTAFEITMKHEGLYSNDPIDAGGETYRGITKTYHPTWKGWELVYDFQKEPNNEYLKKELNRSVKEFYKIMYWDRFQGDLIPEQSIANELFDNAVNMGVHRSVKFLQQGLNLLNRNQKDYNDILVDGLFGNDTLNTLKKYLFIDNPIFLIKIMNILQGMHYINYMNKDSKQERFVRGWLKRVSIK